MRKKRLPPRHHSPSEYRSQPRHLSQVAIAPEKLSSLRHRCYSTPRERRLIKFKFRKRAARVARFRRFHCCRCNLILEVRNKKTATELRHRRDYDLALIRSAAEYLQALSNEHVRAVIAIVDGMFFQERNRIANSPRERCCRPSMAFANMSMLAV